MRTDILETMLEKLREGDAVAVAELFRAYEPFLRMVVRRQMSRALRSKFDSIDIVQSLWADIWTGFRENRWQFENAEHLQAFLLRAARNRFVDRWRQQQRALGQSSPQTESPIIDGVAGDEAMPSEMAVANDLWEQMLELCPPQHHELLRLKRAGHNLQEIAARTGLHEGSVRRILYGLAKKLSESRKEDEAREEASESTPCLD